MNVIHEIKQPRDGRAARREARRRAILDEARAAMADGGFEALTLAPLARRLGYAVGALYRYFPSKEALLVALQVELLGELARRLEAGAEAARARTEAAPLGRILGRCRVYRGLSEARSEEFRMISFTVGDPRVLVPDDEARPVLDAAQPLLGALAADLAAAVEAGDLEPGDPVERALVLWSGLHGVLLTDKLGRIAPAFDADRLARTFVPALLRGWGASPDDLQTLDDAIAELPAALWAADLEPTS